MKLLVLMLSTIFFTFFIEISVFILLKFYQFSVESFSTLLMDSFVIFLVFKDFFFQSCVFVSLFNFFSYQVVVFLKFILVSNFILLLFSNFLLVTLHIELWYALFVNFSVFFYFRQILYKPIEVFISFLKSEQVWIILTLIVYRVSFVIVFGYRVMLISNEFVKFILEPIKVHMHGIFSL